MRILVTGATGFLGTHVIPLLSDFASVKSISRSQPDCIIGDLSQWDGKLKPKELRGQFDLMLHMAGLYDLRVQPVEALRNNVAATHTALTIAQKAEIPHFVHISTVAVTLGQNKERIFPHELTTSARYPDHYSSTKAHAEHLVRFWSTGNFRSKLVLRLGILVGDQKQGAINRIDGPYHTAEFLTKMRDILKSYQGPLPLPGKTQKTLPVVPVDAAAQAISRLVKMTLEENWEGYKALHLVPKKGLNAETLYKSALRRLNLRNDVLLTGSLVPKTLIKPLAEALAQIPKEELEYLLSLPELENSETRRLLGENWCPEFEEYEEAFWSGYEKFVSNR